MQPRRFRGGWLARINREWMDPAPEGLQQNAGGGWFWPCRCRGGWLARVGPRINGSRLRWAEGARQRASDRSGRIWFRRTCRSQLACVDYGCMDLAPECRSRKLKLDGSTFGGATEEAGARRPKSGWIPQRKSCTKKLGAEGSGTERTAEAGLRASARSGRIPPRKSCACLPTCVGQEWTEPAHGPSGVQRPGVDGPRLGRAASES